MKSKYAVAVRVLGVVLSAALLYGCPASAGRNVAWLVNSTVDRTYTHFLYDATGNPKTVPLETPLTPGSAQRFEFDNAFRGTVTHVGLSGSGFLFAFPNNNAFGFGTTDVLAVYQCSTSYGSQWYKSAN